MSQGASECADCPGVIGGCICDATPATYVGDRASMLTKWYWHKIPANPSIYVVLAAAVSLLCNDRQVSLLYKRRLCMQGIWNTDVGRV